MSRHTLAVFLVLAIAQLFVIHQAKGAGVAVKGTCDASAALGSATGCDDTAASMLTCEGTTCKAKIGGTCTAASTDQCVAGAAACPAGATCVCPADMGPNSDNTGCQALKKIGETCTATADCVATADACTTKCACTSPKVNLDDNSGCGKKVGETCTVATDCSTNAECTSTKCACKTGYTKTDDDKCSGAAAVMTSLVLLVASFLTSRVM